MQLAALGLSLSDVVDALERNNANRGAGYVERGGEQILIRVPGQASDEGDLGNIMIATRGGVPIRVSDVAEVAIGSELRSGASTENGRAIVIGTVLMLTGENPRDVPQAAADRQEQITAVLPARPCSTHLYTTHTTVQRPP